MLFCCFVVQQIAKVLQQASWTVENHNWCTVFEPRGRACWGGKDNWGERSEPHTCGENGKLSIYMYVWYVRIPYIHILPHLCAMQYFHIACWCMLTTVVQERRLAGQKGWTVRTNVTGTWKRWGREARLARRRLVINMLRDTAANGECSVY